MTRNRESKVGVRTLQEEWCHPYALIHEVKDKDREMNIHRYECSYLIQLCSLLPKSNAKAYKYCSMLRDEFF
jgi:hypothetical protein